MSEQPIANPLQAQRFSTISKPALQQLHARSVDYVERQAIKLELLRRRTT